MINLTKELNYRQCAKTVMDTVGDPDIYFDPEGNSSYVHQYYANILPSIVNEADREKNFIEAIEKIKKAGSGKPYDCILGLSGGADSSYVVHLAKTNGLRPLIVHFDNGWDSELAVKNIDNLLRKTGFEYYNYVIDWEEFRDLQLAYLKASVVDIEIATDHAISALLYKMAAKHKIKYILAGDNPFTERIMPKSWTYVKNDIANLKDIHKKFGKLQLKSYPLLGLYKQTIYQVLFKIEIVNLIHYKPLPHLEVLKLLDKEYNYRDYKWKHCESVFTRFYQGYILPIKFNIDKRKAHLSNLILSGQITKTEALEKLEQPYYTDDELKADIDFTCRKFGLTREEFDAIMNNPIVPHSMFAQEKWTIWKMIKVKMWKKAGELLNM